jgi:hypothetical protein
MAKDAAYKIMAKDAAYKITTCYSLLAATSVTMSCTPMPAWFLLTTHRITGPTWSAAAELHLAFRPLSNA